MAKNASCSILEMAERSCFAQTTPFFSPVPVPLVAAALLPLPALPLLLPLVLPLLVVLLFRSRWLSTKFVRITRSCNLSTQSRGKFSNQYFSMEMTLLFLLLLPLVLLLRELFPELVLLLLLLLISGLLVVSKLVLSVRGVSIRLAAQLLLLLAK